MVRNPPLICAPTCTVANSVQEGVNLHQETVVMGQLVFASCAFQLLQFGLTSCLLRSPICGVSASDI